VRKAMKKALKRDFARGIGPQIQRFGDRRSKQAVADRSENQ
jgi:hypothetical protein